MLDMHIHYLGKNLFLYAVVTDNTRQGRAMTVQALPFLGSSISLKVLVERFSFPW